MSEVTINGTRYAVDQCGDCEGSGEKTDPTCADAIAPGPFAGVCAVCSGRGRVYRNLVTAARLADDRTELKSRLDRQEIGDMPDWMI